MSNSMKRISMMAIGVATLVGSGGCGASVTVTPEARVASAVQVLAGAAQEYQGERRQYLKERQELLAGDRAAAAMASTDAEQRLTVWKLTNDQRRVAIYDQLRAATKAAGDTWSAYEQLARDQAKAVDEVDTKFAVSSAALADIVKSLTTLGTPASLEDQTKLYVKFFLDAKADVESQIAKDKQKANSATGSGTSPPSSK